MLPVAVAQVGQPSGQGAGQSAIIEAFQKQIQQLLNQVQALQQQVTELRSELGATAPAVTPPVPEAASVPLPEFIRPLSLGSSGDDVRKLQEFLAQDRIIYPEALSTGYFGPLTERAVKRWQEKHGIEQVGRVGPKTIARLNELIAEGAGRSGVVPPGLLTAPGLEGKIVTTTVATTTPPSVPPTVATTTPPSLATTTTGIVTSTQPTATSTPYTPPATYAPPSAPVASTTAAPATSTSVTTATTTAATPSVAGSIRVEWNWIRSLVTNPVRIDAYLNVWYPESSPKTFNAYFREPGSSTFNKLVFANKSPAIPVSSGESLWVLSIREPLPNIYQAVGQYQAYATVVDSNGNESAPSPTTSRTLYDGPTILSPIANSDQTQPFQISLQNSTPASSPTFNVFIRTASQPTQARSYLWDAFSKPASFTYDGPVLQTSDNPHRFYAYMDKGYDAYTQFTESAFNVIVPDQSSLIGYWKFDGNGNNEVAGGPAAVTVGNAFFNASGTRGGYAFIPSSGDYVKIPYSSAFDLPNSFTVEFWFRQRSNQSFQQDLVYKGTSLNNYNFRIFRQLWNEYNSGSIITGYTSSQTGYWTQTSNPNQLAHDAWHHVAFVKSPTWRGYYLDGALIHSETDSPPAKTPANDIIIGDSAVDTDIDALRIYNRALSPSEVLQSSQASLGPGKLKDFEGQLASIAAVLSRLAEEIKKLLGR